MRWTVDGVGVAEAVASQLVVGERLIASVVESDGQCVAFEGGDGASFAGDEPPVA
jgi:uncharacterized protein GlcG (DUF336 family)